MNWILREVRMLLPEGEREGDAWIKEGRWQALGVVPDKAVGKEVRAKGMYLLPGLIDTHVHFREPGLTHKGNLYTESRAALAGGVTTIFDMPNTSPPTTTQERWEAKMHLAQNRCWTNYAFYFGATSDNIKEIHRLSPKAVPGVKIFLASSTGELLLTDEKILHRLVRESPVRLVFHSEKESLIQAAQRQYPSATWEKVPDLHYRLRPPEACIESTRWLLELACESQVALHIVHLTTAQEVNLLRHRPAHVSAETCPVYLTWSKEDFPRYRNFLKCNPSLKRIEDQEMLWRGLEEGVIEVVGTDHAPHTIEEKMRSYYEAPSGVPAHGYLLPWLYTIGQARGLSLSFWVEKMAHAPARLWNIQQRGMLREGFWADGVLFDAQASTRVPSVGSAQHYSLCRWSPLAGRTLHGKVQATWVNGQLSFWDGTFHAPAAGRAVDFA
ncbi:MAG: amidohydrolase family protein [Bacteroidia bacterium]|nr:amidohydrolase family protein [Bacteroidia bacterium]MDW8235058.1 amidohydrolase family protein [Bacteroidia bacterium]